MRSVGPAPANASCTAEKRVKLELLRGYALTTITTCGGALGDGKCVSLAVSSQAWRLLNNFVTREVRRSKDPLLECQWNGRQAEYLLFQRLSTRIMVMTQFTRCGVGLHIVSSHSCALSIDICI